VCTQVAEYVADVDRVFSEAFRVLKPNGRTVFVVTDWHTILWHSDNPRRMAAVMTSWEGHSAHPRLPMSMADRFIKARFRFDGAAVFPILNLQYDEDRYSWGLAQIVRNFVAGKNDVSADDLKDWHNEFKRLSEAGKYFFGSSRYIFKASKPPL
jgi:arsenite methyltransferase